MRVLLLTLLMVASSVMAGGEGSIAAHDGAIRPFAREAVQPLVERGRQAAASGRHAAAIDAFEQAQHILHRHEGVHTLSQVDLVREMVHSHLERGDVSAADRLMHFRYDLHREHFGPRDPGIVPATLELANWYQARARFRDAERLYLQALETLERSDITGRPMQRTLNLLSFTEYLQGRCCDVDKVDAAIDAVMADNSIDFAGRARALREGADMLVMAGHGQRALPLYEQARHLARAPERGASPTWLGVSRGDRMMRAYEPFVSRHEHQSADVRQAVPPPGLLVGSPLAFCAAQLDRLVRHRGYRDFEIDLEFHVDASGRPKQIRVVESNAPASVSVLATRVLRTSRFRPVIRDGQVVDEPMTLTQRFDEPVSLSGGSPFPPATTAVFHACQKMARQ